MSWVTPLGFIGFLGVAALIAIYLIKPNYQNKIISSTFVWKLSLKYQKKRIPIDRFRNILLFICQLLLLTACAFLLAKPVIFDEAEVFANEKIVVIEASCNMRARVDGETRFERAVKEVKELAGKVAESDGRLTVILAESEATLIAEQSAPEDLTDLYGLLDELIVPGNLRCSYGSADMDGAVALAEEYLKNNPTAEVSVYTAADYLSKGGAEIIDVSTPGEWNAAVLYGYAENIDNYYVFSADIAVYGRDTDVILLCDIYETNYDKKNITVQLPIRCNSDKPMHIEFNAQNCVELFARPIYSFTYARFYVVADDSLPLDNDFVVYGGEKHKIRIQYYSSNPNAFYLSMLRTLREKMSDLWDIEVRQVAQGSEPELEGYDFYVFEHRMPEMIPTDGVVLLANLDRVPQNLTDISIIDEKTGDFPLTEGKPHPVTSHINMKNLQLTAYKIIKASDQYIPLAYSAGAPVLLMKNQIESKVIVFSFSVNRSSLFAVTVELPALIMELFKFYFPPTVSEFVYDIGDTANVNARASTLSVSGPAPSMRFTEFPAEIKFDLPGTYTFSQKPISGRTETDSVFVKIPASESNIFPEREVLKITSRAVQTEGADFDLLIILASIIVGLLLLERFLQFGGKV